MATAPARRAAAPTRQAAPAAPAVNFGESSFYSGMMMMPEGDYALYHDIRMHAFTKKDGVTKGVEDLGVMVTAYPLNGGEPHEQFYRMGRKAKESFAPNMALVVTDADGVERCKGIQAIPGSSGTGLSGMTNWDLYRKSLLDCGLPEGVFTNDISVLDGLWAHIQNQPAPAERKQFGSKTAEREGEEEQKGPDLVPVVTEILQGGEPWNGGGGLPDAASAPAPKAPAARPAAARAAAPAARTAAPARRAPAPAPVEEEEAAEEAAGEVTEESVAQAALEGITAVLEKDGKPMKIKVKTGTFSHVQKLYGDEMAQAVSETLNDEGQLKQLMASAGYKLVGAQFVPA